MGCGIVHGCFSGKLRRALLTPLNAAGEKAVVLGEVVEETRGCAVLNIPVCWCPAAAQICRNSLTLRMQRDQKRMPSGLSYPAGRMLFALERAQKAGIETVVLCRKDFPDVDAYSQALIDGTA